VPGLFYRIVTAAVTPFSVLFSFWGPGVASGGMFQYMGDDVIQL